MGQGARLSRRRRSSPVRAIWTSGSGAQQGPHGRAHAIDAVCRRAGIPRELRRAPTPRLRARLHHPHRGAHRRYPWPRARGRAADAVEHVDLDAALWSIPKGKNGKEHRVPLSPSAVALLNGLPRKGDIVFPGPGRTSRSAKAQCSACSPRWAAMRRRTACARASRPGHQSAPILPGKSREARRHTRSTILWRPHTGGAICSKNAES